MTQKKNRKEPVHLPSAEEIQNELGRGAAPDGTGFTGLSVVGDAESVQSSHHQASRARTAREFGETGS